MNSCVEQEMETVEEIPDEEERRIVYLKDEYLPQEYGCGIVCTAHCTCASKQK